MSARPVHIVAAVIPSYKVKIHILTLLAAIEDNVHLIYVVDDCCPHGSGQYVAENCSDPRVTVLYNEINQGVGGAVMTGYRKAVEDGADIIVKLDGDGQMDPAILQDFVQPIMDGEADYTKGNRFYDLEQIHQMPAVRIFGNAALSFLSKLSTGYWDLFDPTNGYTAIAADVVKRLPLGKISKRYFFETDLLFRLNAIRAVVVDVPMNARYGDEVSNLKITHVFKTFLASNIRNTFKRIFYNYYLRDMSVASIELPAGLTMIAFGLCYGGYHWIQSIHLDMPAASGVVMLPALSIILGVQFVLAFLAYDIRSIPHRIIHRKKH
ncbi:glycosyltransferase involved in cell wall biosynthesis [Silvimonas terrae]|uniref:Glycosyltransferase involved in cell wall biosynthesis n=1 Tax=Silvimonas terrae TaxID=300266 RepID=A0A840RJQ2_9NEIS|nr:glycosyltransferase family 2 protein [Silvimonas terrae]MBB5192472.1 glycosyltransferase involved in cell wall biosynthesis [Silvimonas terrae]